MAVLTAVRKYRDGAGLIHAVYLQGAVTAADTLQTSADFSKVVYATAWNLAGGAVVTMAISSNTTLTVGTGPSADDLVVFVVGAAA